MISGIRLLLVLCLVTMLPAAGAAGGVADVLKSFGSGRSEPEFLPPEKAFRVEAAMRDASSAVVRFAPAEGYYLYKEKLAFRADGSDRLSVALPPAQSKQDPTFGRTEVYHEPFEAVIELRGGGGTRTRLDVDYQGCAEQGLCYAPMTKTFELDLVGGSAAPIAAASPVGSVAEDSHIATTLRDGGLWASIAAFFGFGLLLAFTPCVFPMIPILSGIIAGHEHAKLTHTRGFLLSLAYVLGMALTYAVAGVAAALSGTMLSAALRRRGCSSPSRPSSCCLPARCLVCTTFSFRPCCRASSPKRQTVFTAVISRACLAWGRYRHSLSDPAWHRP